MTRRTHALSFLMFVSMIAGLTGACGGEPVGRLCDLGGIDGISDSTAVVSSPSLDCTTRTCLKVPLTRSLPEGGRYPTGNKGLCTAACETEEDCERVPESPCTLGFTCAIPTVVGPFCCQKFCVCKDYMLLPESGIPPIPSACDASNANNECCNLEGRPGNYPGCPAE